MTPIAHLVLLVFAFVCFVLAAWNAPEPEPNWRRLVAIGLAFLVASMISW